VRNPGGVYVLGGWRWEMRAGRCVSRRGGVAVGGVVWQWVVWCGVAGGEMGKMGGMGGRFDSHQMK
jgi:hypothetical protein